MTDFHRNIYSEPTRPEEDEEPPRRHLRAVTDPSETKIPSKESLLEQRRRLLERKADTERDFARKIAALDNELRGVNDTILGISDTHDSGVRSREREQKIKEYTASPESIIEHRIITIQIKRADIERYKKMLAGELKRQISSEDGQPLGDEKILANIKILEGDIAHLWEEIIQISSNVNESERQQKAA